MIMRVLLVTTHLDRSETALFLGLQDSGIEIHAICHPGAVHYQDLQMHLASVTPAVIRKRLHPSAIKIIRSKLLSQRFDIIHALRKPALSNSLIAAKKSSARIVAYRGIVGNQSFWDPFSWMTFLHPRIDRVICVAEAIRQFFLEMRFLSFRLPRDRFVTIYKGHDIDWYRSDAVFDRSRLGVEEHALLIGCVANMRPRKGIPVLIEAFGRINYPKPVHLFLVGDVQDRRIMQVRQLSPVKDRIHLLGFRKDATAIAGSFDLFVLPSLSREGLARSLLEAMAQRVPAVVTSAGGSPEVVVDYECGRVVPPGDELQLASAIQFCIEEPERRVKLGWNARERVREKFNIETTIQKTRALYEDLV